MIKTQIDGMVLAASVVAAALGFFLLSGAFFWMGSIAGLTLAIVLFAFDREGARSVFESLAFGAVVALSLALAAATPLAWIRAHNAQNASFAGPIGADWLPYIWLALTILLWIVDRARMGARVQHVPVPQPVPSFRPTAVPTTAAAVLASEPQPRAPEPASPPVEAHVSEPAARSEPAEPSPALPPRAVPVPAGKEATIYVSLVGEGLNVLRAVRAEHLGRDFYKVAEEMPEGETWQFGPGQIVRCRKKNLSSGKAMVAVEEAPRAQ